LASLSLNLLQDILLRLLPGFATLDNSFEFKHHCHKLRVFDGGQYPVKTYQVLSILSVYALAYLEHMFSGDIFNNQELIELLIKLFDVLLEYCIAFQALFLNIVLELEAMFIAEGLQELLEVALLAEGLQTRDKVEV
jgi:hypothetical protein